KRLTPKAQRRALRALRRFGQRLHALPRGSVRAVGTNALRQARNARAFLQRARRELGHPIEVVSGREEARLIYAGVAHSLPTQAGRRLVLDIGGGSTECILGERFEPLLADSLFMGCVTWSRRFFPRGDLSDKAMEQAVHAAQREVQTLERSYQAQGWERCIGSSGTILAIAAILREQGWDEQGAITRRGLRKLRRAVVQARSTRRLSLPGLSPERADVLPGGLAILSGVFEELGLRSMSTCAGSLREGLLHDLLGRIRQVDPREHTIRELAARWHVDAEQAARVERTVLECLAQVAHAWGLQGEEPRLLLGWAARLHEIGLAIGYSGHHKHGAYLLQHADLPGFTREEQRQLALLVAAHRRRVPLDLFGDGPAAESQDLLALALLLRLAVVLNRARSTRPLPRLRLQARPAGLVARFPRGWLRQHDLVREDLEDEAALLQAAGLGLEVR
ncbi:MAG: Ppx/GppA family phosphatase, partial [Planctomycetes bacterium]|nr:Ppx/GppA family phosphatase [Planctomycetota bacterium]